DLRRGQRPFEGIRHHKDLLQNGTLLSTGKCRGRVSARRCFYDTFAPPKKQAGQQKRLSGGRPSQESLRLSKKSKSVSVGGHAPTTETPTGKFCGKLCARSEATSARFAVKFCRRGFQKGKQTR